MLRKKFRLKKKKDFAEVLKKGKSRRENFLILKILKNDLILTRVGFVVGKKISKKATVRNKIKRRLREAVKTYITKINSGYDLVFLAEKGIEEKSFYEIEKVVKSLLEKIKILKK